MSVGGFQTNYISSILLLTRVSPVGTAGMRAVKILSEAELSSEEPIALTD